MTSIGFFCWPNEYFSFGNIANAIDVHRWPFPARSSCSSISISLWLIHNPVNPFPARWHRCQFSHQRQLLKPLATTKTWATTGLVLAPFTLTRIFRTFPARPRSHSSPLGIEGAGKTIVDKNICMHSGCTCPNRRAGDAAAPQRCCAACVAIGGGALNMQHL